MGLIPTTVQAGRAPGFPSGKTWLIYGPPKIGKTELASQFPKPLIIECEVGGAEELKGVKVAKPVNLDEVSEILGELEGPAGKEFETIVIDTIDEVYDWYEVEVCRDLSKKFKLAIDNIGEGPKGADWAEARKRMMGFMSVWKGLGKNIVYLAHSTAVMGEQGLVSQKAKTIDFPGKLGRRIPARVDVVGYCYGVREAGPDKKLTINRYISFQPYEELEAGCRLKELSGKIIPMTFQAIKACFESSGQKTKKQ